MATKKATVSDVEIIKNIKAGNYASVYGLDGEEPYYIDKITDYIEQNILTPAEKDFNLTVFYGKDADWSEVVSACRRYPMFAEKQIVILKEAQTFANIEKLEIYLENPMPTTIFVIAYKYKKFDGRTAFAKLIQKKGIYFTSDVVKEYNINAWISNYLADKKIQASNKVVETLAAYLGTDLQKIINEIDKVLINVPDAKELTIELIEKYIGISKEYNVFELPNAILKGDVDKTFRMINYFIDNPKDAPMVLVLGSLFNNLQKLYTYHFVSNKTDGEKASALKISPYFVKDYTAFARRYNLQKTETALQLLKYYNLKTIGVNSNANYSNLLKEMCTKLFYL